MSLFKAAPEYCKHSEHQYSLSISERDRYFIVYAVRTGWILEFQPNHTFSIIAAINFTFLIEIGVNDTLQYVQLISWSTLYIVYKYCITNRNDPIIYMFRKWNNMLLYVYFISENVSHSHLSIGNKRSSRNMKFYSSGAVSIHIRFSV